MVKKTATLLLALALAIGGTACAGSDTASGQSEQAVQSQQTPDAAESASAEPAGQGGSTEGEIVILFPNGMVDDAPFGTAVKESIQNYNDANEGVTVQFQATSQQDILDQFKTAALAGSGADIAMMDSSGHAVDLAAMDLLLPMTDFIPEAELLEAYAEGPLNSGKFRGNYYSIPWYMDNCGLYYNTKRLEELGVGVPTNWEEFENAIAKATEAGYGGIISDLSAYEMYAFFYQSGCPVIDTSGDIPSVVVNNDAGKAAWEYWCGLHLKHGGFVESFKEATTWDKVYESFANGEATFLLGGDWCATGIERINPDLEYGITTMPEGTQKATILGGWTFNINKNSAHPELAYNFIRYMTSPETDWVIEADGKTTARLGVDYTKALANYPERIIFTEQIPYTMPRPAIIN